MIKIMNRKKISKKLCIMHYELCINSNFFLNFTNEKK